ncbi:nuclear transport factor 2 family protein [Bosea sp. NPDC055332]
MSADPGFAEIVAALGDYFDGLHHSDADRLGQLFHPQAIYACGTGGSLTHLTMAEYLPMVAKRPSPASRGEARHDRTLSIEFAGPVTALARVECTIGPKRFTDLLSFIRLDGRWRLIAKVFHFDLDQAAA